MEPQELYALGTLILGLITCFYGFSLLEYLLAAAGFWIGAGLGAAIGGQLAAHSLMAVLGGAVIGGIGGAVLLIYVFPLALALFGFLFGAFAGSALNSLIDLNQEVPLMVGIGLLAAFLALKFQKFLIVVSTSFDGAAALLLGGVALMESAEWLPGPPRSLRERVGTSDVIPLVWIALGLLGVLVQYNLTAPDRHQLRRLEDAYWQDHE